MQLPSASRGPASVEQCLMKKELTCMYKLGAPLEPTWQGQLQLYSVFLSLIDFVSLLACIIIDMTSNLLSNPLSRYTLL